MATNVEAEMVANVWKGLVGPGARVASGDTLVILESMKMEIPVEAPVDGTVSAVNVEEGGVVQEGDVIAVIDAERAGQSGGHMWPRTYPDLANSWHTAEPAFVARPGCSRVCRRYLGREPGLCWDSV